MGCDYYIIHWIDVSYIEKGIKHSVSIETYREEQYFSLTDSSSDSDDDEEILEERRRKYDMALEKEVENVSNKGMKIVCHKANWLTSKSRQRYYLDTILKEIESKEKNVKILKIVKRREGLIRH